MGKYTSWDSEAPLVIAHRGASSLAPENTLAAFRLAMELGADGIELDAKLSSDGIVVVHHDRTLDRTTDGTGLLGGKTAAELLALDAGSSFDNAFRGEKIPTLEEVFTEFGQSVLINVELTNYGSILDSLVPAVVGLITAHGLKSQVLLSSFNPLAIWQAARAAPGIRRAFLLAGCGLGFFEMIAAHIFPFDDLHPAAQLITPALIARQHQLGKRVRAWTVNDQETLVELFKMDIDGIITDVPDRALLARQGTKRERS